MLDGLAKRVTSAAMLSRSSRWAVDAVLTRRPRVTAITAVTGSKRCLACSRQVARQRLFWAGSVLDRVSPYLQEVPKDWLMSIGMGQDAEDGMTFTHLAGSVSHSLLAYRTVPGKLAQGRNEEGGPALKETVILSSGEEAPDFEDDSFSKIIAIGRNTQGQLGLGFTSQESSWGMVQSGFEGRQVASICAGNGSSFIVMEQEDGSSKLFAFGNHTSGQLGLKHASDMTPTTVIGNEQKAQTLFSSPTAVPLPEVAGSPARVVSIAAGLDHLILLCEPTSEGKEGRVVYTCGLNTDGQLGVEGEAHRISSKEVLLVNPKDFALGDGESLMGVAAGGDNSFAWSSTGRVWSWGNSEYGQGAHGKAIDRIDTPLEATSTLREAGITTVKSIVAGGSFAAILDDEGKLFAVGYGAIGQGPEHLHTLHPKLIEAADFYDVASDLEYIAAIGADNKLRTWGLDTMSGRLALDPPSRKPWPSFMIASRFTPDASRLPESASSAGPAEEGSSETGGHRKMLLHHLPSEVHSNRSLDQMRIEKLACSGETLWVLAEDGEAPEGVWKAPE